MAAPTPAQFEDHLRETHKAVERLRYEFRWVFGAAYAKNVTDDVKVAAGGRSDPTGNVTGSTEKGRQRRALQQADERVLDALGALRASESRLRDAAERDRERIEFAALRYPRSASRADLDAAREAKLRREGRNEGWGSA